MSFKVGEIYKTRDGRDARVICVDAEIYDTKSVIAIIKDGSGVDIVRFYYADGAYSLYEQVTSVDLMPPMRTVYSNLYFNGHAHYHDDKDEAIRAAECCNDSCLHVAIPVEIPDA